MSILLTSSLTNSYDEQNFQAFYTDNDEIRLLMQNLLGNVDNKRVIDPCAGEGAFLDGLHGKPSLIHALDIDQEHIDFLQQRFGEEIFSLHTDFIDLFVSDSETNKEITSSRYDRIICNPPYGLKFTVEYRKLIKKKYPHLYARESYGLFLYFGINLLIEGGRFVYIVPDTFFTSKNHTPLRSFLANETKITDIIQFQTKRFETVNFGYGNLCIIAGFKKKPTDSDEVRWSDARKSKARLKDELSNKSEQVPQCFLKKGISTGWIHPEIIRATAPPENSLMLGEIAECRTGIYTGNNQEFCAYDEANPPSRPNGHSINWKDFVYENTLTSNEKLQGLTGDCCYVPFIRGGHRKPFDGTHHAINWSKKAVSFYRDNKKSRLQNHAFYFKKGLAVPMVTSGRLTASLIDRAIFDQGVVGIFPHNEDYISFLLIYLNSDIVSKYKSLITPGANNSANYLKRIPVPKISTETLKKANDIVERSREHGWMKTESDRNNLIAEILDLPS